jgi:hypothetical protein
VERKDLSVIGLLLAGWGCDFFDLSDTTIPKELENIRYDLFLPQQAGYFYHSRMPPSQLPALRWDDVIILKNELTMGFLAFFAYISCLSLTVFKDAFGYSFLFLIPLQAFWDAILCRLVFYLQYTY